ncbi:MAG: type II toxin-antitoxin system RelE/ParE family toxin [Thermoanaerobaculia bacterium]|nr:type II toxin-antitoxin system RelE/ParE family toxin [Thermoanaerobaculia bacterium]
MSGWVLSPLALSELEDILKYIAEESGSAAICEKVASDFMAAFDNLAASPGIGWKREDLTGRSIRWWRVHSYLAAYNPETKPLRVIRIVHGARNLDSLFQSEH